MESTRFTITMATTTDLDAIRLLFRAYAASLPVDLAYQDFAAELAGLPGAYAPPGGTLLLARDSNAVPLGCAALRPMPQAGWGEMKRLYVAPEARGLGVGRALAEAVIAAARQAGYRELRLDTLPAMTSAQALYRQLGFTPVAPYYDTPIEGTVFLARRLDAWTADEHPARS
jgi:ribosomal protein S18 acetylase RimI-like enzyme